MFNNIKFVCLLHFHYLSPFPFPAITIDKIDIFCHYFLFQNINYCESVNFVSSLFFCNFA